MTWRDGDDLASSQHREPRVNPRLGQESPLKRRVLRGGLLRMESGRVSIASRG
ncbi:MAG: hypothetical protein ABR551_09490 [Gemmatimonadales bacterium]